MEKIKTLSDSYHTVGNKMQSIQFLYWLQGCFELAETEKLSAKQIEILQKHLEITEKGHDFLIWLKGFLIGKEKGLTKEYTEILKKELEKCFINVTQPDEATKSLEEYLKTLPKKSPSLPFPNPPYPWLDKNWRFGDIIC